MTREEAIRFGKCILMVADDKSDSTTIEFTKLALKALEQCDVLQDIKKEIELKEKTLTDKYGQVKYGVWTDDVCNVFDKYIEKYSNT